MTTLSLSRLERPDTAPGGSRTPRSHLDFVISGQSLFKLTGAGNHDLIGLLGWAGDEQDALSVRQLCLEVATELPANRQPIFVCGECGDIGCGAVTVEISHEGNEFVWADFAYENNYDPNMTDRESYARLGPFRFPAHEYRVVLLSLQSGAA